MSKVFSVEESLKSLEKDIKDLTKEMEQKARAQVQVLAAAAHSMIAKKAQTKLKSTREKYINALDITKIQDDGSNTIWAVTLGKEAGWIEDGQPAHNMLDYLLKSKKAKTSKDGGKYLVIPFQHNKPSNQRSESQNKIAKFVNKELKDQGLDKVITRDGKAVLGRAATVEIKGKDQPVARFNQPILKGLTIYQHVKKNAKGEEQKHEDGSPKIQRDVMTFRIASSSQIGSGLWEKNASPGLQAFSEVEKELDKIWETMINSIVEGS